jgi:hypothetical protein
MRGEGFPRWQGLPEAGNGCSLSMTPWESQRKILFSGVRVSGLPRKSEDCSKKSFIPIDGSWKRITLNTFEKLLFSIYSEFSILLLFLPLPLD